MVSYDSHNCLSSFLDSKLEDWDIWEHIASKLDVAEILQLALSCQWFWKNLMTNVVWKRTFLKKLGLPIDAAVVDPPYSWFRLYESNFGGMHFGFADPDHRVYVGHIGAFILKSEATIATDFLGMEGSPEEIVQRILESETTATVKDVKPGLWILESSFRFCQCTPDCFGLDLSFDARHVELFLREEFLGGEFGSYLSDIKSFNIMHDRHHPVSTVSGIFDNVHLTDIPRSCIFYPPIWNEMVKVANDAIGFRTDFVVYWHGGLVRVRCVKSTINGEVMSISVTKVA